MDDDKLEPTSTSNTAGSASGCGPGCNCATTRISKKGKVVICLVVAIAAVVVLANSVMQKDQGQNAYAVAALAAVKDSPSPPVTAERANETNQVNSSLWGKPLESLASLNDVAAQKDAVFVYLPAKGKRLDEHAKKEIEAAAGKAQSQGIMMSLYTLAEGSKDYEQATSQVPAPAVLALVKGVGSSTGITNISEENLLQGLVAASRPSGGCSPGSSCSPGSCGPQTTKSMQI